MIQVLLFARLRDELGTDCLRMNLPEPCTVASLRLALQQHFPHQTDVLAAGRALVAINQALTNDENAIVCATDEIALLPPMTGG
ncbi:MoaD/ThiS family protein [Oceanobacter antarcticus]|jgi:molybdopterin synthase sulfur carrier subunit|uniref:Molybdopterin synthase sulfur carrier subunit n=1 Tax=Oceanobacter antarcticus TaxID=3133425 RepID=A0ABW8NNQ5_9GAMM|tara:strand:- start:309 stop:560 length:252 start_codon:yes stop_codon:yes gene_type:complete